MRSEKFRSLNQQSNDKQNCSRRIVQEIVHVTEFLETKTECELNFNDVFNDCFQFQ